MGGEALAETDLSGNNPTEFVFFGTRRIARRYPTGIQFTFSNSESPF